MPMSSVQQHVVAHPNSCRRLNCLCPRCATKPSVSRPPSSVAGFRGYFPALPRQGAPGGRFQGGCDDRGVHRESGGTQGWNPLRYPRSGGYSIVSPSVRIQCPGGNTLAARWLSPESVEPQLSPGGLGYARGQSHRCRPLDVQRRYGGGSSRAVSGSLPLFPSTPAHSDPLRPGRRCQRGQSTGVLCGCRRVGSRLWFHARERTTSALAFSRLSIPLEFVVVLEDDLLFSVVFRSNCTSRPAEVVLGGLSGFQR